MMVLEALLPSEVARLVYGYLTDEKCLETANKFLNESPNLQECRSVLSYGRNFSTRVCGYALEEILDKFCLINSVVQEEIEKSGSSDKLKDIDLVSQIKFFLEESKSEHFRNNFNEVITITSSQISQQNSSTTENASPTKLHRKQFYFNQNEDKQGNKNMDVDVENPTQSTLVQNPTNSIETTLLKNLPGYVNNLQNQKNDKYKYKSQKNSGEFIKTIDIVQNEKADKNFSVQETQKESQFSCKQKNNEVKEGTAIDCAEKKLEQCSNVAVQISDNDSYNKIEKNVLIDDKLFNDAEVQTLNLTSPASDVLPPNQCVEFLSEMTTKILDRTEIQERIATKINNILTPLKFNSQKSTETDNENSIKTFTGLNKVVEEAVNATENDPEFLKLLDEIFQLSEDSTTEDEDTDVNNSGENSIAESLQKNTDANNDQCTILKNNDQIVPTVSETNDPVHTINIESTNKITSDQTITEKENIQISKSRENDNSHDKENNEPSLTNTLESPILAKSIQTSEGICIHNTTSTPIKIFTAVQNFETPDWFTTQDLETPNKSYSKADYNPTLKTNYNYAFTACETITSNSFFSPIISKETSKEAEKITDQTLHTPEIVYSTKIINVPNNNTTATITNCPKDNTPATIINFINNNATLTTKSASKDKTPPVLQKTSELIDELLNSNSVQKTNENSNNLSSLLKDSKQSDKILETDTIMLFGMDNNATTVPSSVIIPEIELEDSVTFTGTGLSPFLKINRKSENNIESKKIDEISTPNVITQVMKTQEEQVKVSSKERSEIYVISSKNNEASLTKIDISNLDLIIKSTPQMIFDDRTQNNRLSLSTPKKNTYVRAIDFDAPYNRCQSEGTVKILDNGQSPDVLTKNMKTSCISHLFQSPPFTGSDNIDYSKRITLTNGVIQKVNQGASTSTSTTHNLAISTLTSTTNSLGASTSNSETINLVPLTSSSAIINFEIPTSISATINLGASNSATTTNNLIPPTSSSTAINLGPSTSTSTSTTNNLVASFSTSVNSDLKSYDINAVDIQENQDKNLETESTLKSKHEDVKSTDSKKNNDLKKDWDTDLRKYLGPIETNPKQPIKNRKRKLEEDSNKKTPKKSRKSKSTPKNSRKDKSTSKKLRKDKSTPQKSESNENELKKSHPKKNESKKDKFRKNESKKSKRSSKFKKSDENQEKKDKVSQVKFEIPVDADSKQTKDLLMNIPSDSINEHEILKANSVKNEIPKEKLNLSVSKNKKSNQKDEEKNMFDSFERKKQNEAIITEEFEKIAKKIAAKHFPEKDSGQKSVEKKVEEMRLEQDNAVDYDKIEEQLSLIVNNEITESNEQNNSEIIYDHVNKVEKGKVVQKKYARLKTLETNLSQEKKDVPLLKFMLDIETPKTDEKSLDVPPTPQVMSPGSSILMIPHSKMSEDSRTIASFVCESLECPPTPVIVLTPPKKLNDNTLDAQQKSETEITFQPKFIMIEASKKPEITQFEVIKENLKEKTKSESNSEITGENSTEKSTLLEYREIESTVNNDTDTSSTMSSSSCSCNSCTSSLSSDQRIDNAEENVENEEKKVEESQENEGNKKNTENKVNKEHAGNEKDNKNDEIENEHVANEEVITFEQKSEVSPQKVFTIHKTDKEIQETIQETPAKDENLIPEVEIFETPSVSRSTEQQNPTNLNVKISAIMIRKEQEELQKLQTKSKPSIIGVQNITTKIVTKPQTELMKALPLNIQLKALEVKNEQYRSAIVKKLRVEKSKAEIAQAIESITAKRKLLDESLEKLNKSIESTLDSSLVSSEGQKDDKTDTPNKLELFKAIESITKNDSSTEKVELHLDESSSDTNLELILEDEELPQDTKAETNSQQKIEASENIEENNSTTFSEESLGTNDSLNISNNFKDSVPCQEIHIIFDEQSYKRRRRKAYTDEMLTATFVSGSNDEVLDNIISTPFEMLFIINPPRKKRTKKADLANPGPNFERNDEVVDDTVESQPSTSTAINYEDHNVRSKRRRSPDEKRKCKKIKNSDFIY